MLFKMTPVLRYYKNLYHKKNKHRYSVWTGIPSSTTLNNTVFLILLHFSPMTSPQGDFLTKKKAYINMSHSVRKPNLRFGSLSWVGMWSECSPLHLRCQKQPAREKRKKSPAHKTRPSGYLQAAPVPRLCSSVWHCWCLPDRIDFTWLSEMHMTGNYMQQSILFVTQVLINPIWPDLSLDLTCCSQLILFLPNCAIFKS